MSAGVPVALAGAFVHVPRAPVLPPEARYADQRYFCHPGSKSPTALLTGDKGDALVAAAGARVFRSAYCDRAELSFLCSSPMSSIEARLDFGPDALEELARRLVDAAHDLRTRPAMAYTKED